VIISPVYQLARKLLAVPAVLLRRDVSKEAELLVLRHENAVLSRQLTGPRRYSPTDTVLWSHDVWVVDSTPVECGRSKETIRRSDLAGWAEYGYRASYSRYFWGLRPHLVCTLGGLPIGFALTGAKADERQILLGVLNADPTLIGDRPGQTLVGDKNYYGKDFERTLTTAGIDLLRPARKGEPARAEAHLFKPLRQTIESINRTSKANSTWNDTAATPLPESSCASCNASSRSPPRSGTTTSSERQSYVPSPPTITDPLELVI
jgi:hypothetical protein